MKDLIEHYSAYNSGCYSLAKQRLQKEYGSPWILADVCEQKLKKFPIVKSGDGKQLQRFSELLEKAFVIVQDIKGYTTLDSLDTLTELVNKLPFELKRRWVNKSVQIETSTGLLANYCDFMQFVQLQSEEVNSLFGVRTLHTKSSSTKPASSKAKASSFGVVASTSNTKHAKPNLANKFNATCWYCHHASHRLLECKEFSRISVQDRFVFVKESKLCQKCLSSRHRTPDCKRDNPCSVKGCKGKFHHTLLHRYDIYTSEKRKPVDVDAATSTSDVDNNVVCSFANSNDCVKHSSNTYLCIVPVKVTYQHRTFTTYAFLDQGSTHSFCSKTLIAALDISGPKQSLHLTTVTGKTKSYDSMTFELIVSGMNSDKSYFLNKVYTIDDIPVKPNQIPEGPQLPHLDGINMSTLSDASVTLLIGADNPELFCICNARKGLKGTPCAIETPLGWSLLGPSMAGTVNSNCHVNFIAKATTAITEAVEKMWANEFEVGSSVFDYPHSKEDRISYNVMQTKICEANGHYQLPLLWKNNYPELLLNNLSVAQRRLVSPRRRLERDADLKAKYVKVIDSYLSNGYAQKVPQSEEIDNEGAVWYLPHHPVLSPNKPDKVRVVFDCAATYKGMSLNSALMKGPHLMNNLTGVLIRFRQERIALVGDIEAMFHQVMVDPAHINTLRFLWWKDGNLNSTPVAYRMLVHLFGATSSPSCANFALRRVATEFGHLYNPIISSIINHNFYVDDCLISLPTAEEAISVYYDLTEILQRRNFRLTKWTTNHSEVLQSIPATERSTKAHQYLLGNFSDRVLGINWQVHSDEFTFDVHLPKRPFTRRGILSTVASLYDPLGFAVPVILEAKALLQKLCKQRIDWDDPIEHSDVRSWQLWQEKLPHLNNIKVPTCFKPFEFGSISGVQLHYFSDASSYAYGACSYLRMTNENGVVS